MDSTETLATPPGTDPDATTSQDSSSPARVYTQQEFDDAMGKMRAVVTKRAVKPYEDLGDLDELRQMRDDSERRRTDEAVKRGEFERILQEQAQKKDAEIARRDAMIKEFKVDTPLMNAAALLRSVNPEQVKHLLKHSVRLNADGEPEVVDSTGTVRYADSGQPLAVQDLVREFLAANPHFVQPTPATTNSRSSISGSTNTKLDVSKLDMKNPEHRKVYAEYRRTAGMT